MSVINTTSMHKKNSMRIGAITGLILCLPLIAMQFSEEVNWGIADFVIIGALLFGAGMVYEFAVKKIQTKTQQMIAVALLLAILLLIWAELAVGIFDSPLAGS